ncbi:MAG: DUF1987 domain-containing protein [Bacteroidales bacterium]|nr:DUF1987 domain-containing protein [Bacteroidales bacterium]
MNMENILIKENKEAPYYPSVNFNVETGVCEIAGESYMEETFKFYSPLLDWIKEFLKQDQKPLTLKIKLTYFNTNSSRLILDMFDIIKQNKEKGKKIIVNWYYDPTDPDMIDEVEDFEMETGLDINLIELNKQD